MKNNSKIILPVTEKHIKKGRPRSAAGCPIALAIKDMGFSHVSVNPDTAHIFNNLVMKGYRISNPGKRFIQRFDAEKPVKPLTVVLTRWTEHDR